MQLEGFLLISKGIKGLCSFRVIFIYVNVSIFVYKVFFVDYFLCKASSQTSKNSILWIIFPDYVYSTKLVYVGCYFETAIATIFIFFKAFSSYKKLTTKPAFPGKCFINKLLRVCFFQFLCLNLALLTFCSNVKSHLT